MREPMPQTPEERAEDEYWDRLYGTLAVPRPGRRRGVLRRLRPALVDRRRLVDRGLHRGAA